MIAVKKIKILIQKLISLDDFNDLVSAWGIYQDLQELLSPVKGVKACYIYRSFHLVSCNFT